MSTLEENKMNQSIANKFALETFEFIHSKTDHHISYIWQDVRGFQRIRHAICNCGLRLMIYWLDWPIQLINGSFEVMTWGNDEL